MLEFNQEFLLFISNIQYYSTIYLQYIFYIYIFVSFSLLTSQFEGDLKSLFPSCFIGLFMNLINWSEISSILSLFSFNTVSIFNFEISSGGR